MSWKKILVLFLIWRLIDFLIIYFSPKIIPYLGFFSFKDVLNYFNLPSWVTSYANFDGIHYLLIAKRGYSQFQQAFFPLYPLLIKLLTPVFFNNALITGLIISNISFPLGLFFLTKITGIEKKGIPTARTQGALAGMNSRQNLLFLMFFLMSFPTSFFFGALYTEGVFFLLLVLSLYFLKKEKYLLVGLFAILASLTRLIGVFLIIPIFFHCLSKFASSSPDSGRDPPRNKKQTLQVSYLLSLISPFIGLGLYCFYLWKTTGDPLLFFHVQPVFGASRSTNLISLPQVYWRYFKIFFIASHNFQYYVSLFEFSVFNFVFIVLILDLFRNLKIKNLKFIRNWKLEIRNFDRLGLTLFSFINLLLPTLTGTFLSIPRFVLVSLSFFIYLSEIKNKYFKIIIAVIFFVFHVLMLGYFRQGYFIS